MNQEKKMTDVLSKMMLAAAVFCLTLFGAGSYAAPGGSQGSGGWEPSADHQEWVVIAIKTDPVYDDPEAACVALQIGINLLKQEVPDSEDTLTDVTPADRVALFLTLGGVELVNPANAFAGPECDTPDGPLTARLPDLLDGFLSEGGEVIVCPLCAKRRSISAPTRGMMGSGVDIHNLFLFADKVIDF
jgi:hypothetical protein